MQAGCTRDTEEENKTWGYYNKTIVDIVPCKQECDHDKDCGGVEFGVGYCSWWLKKACSPPLLPTDGKTEMTCLVGGMYF